MSPDKDKTFPRLKDNLSTELYRLTVSSDWLYSLFHKKGVLIFHNSLNETAIRSSVLYDVSVLLLSIQENRKKTTESVTEPFL